VQDVAEAVRSGVREGRDAVFGRVVDIKGFSTLPGDVLVAVDAAGTQYGDVLGRPGAEQLQAVARAMFAGGVSRLETVTVAIHGKEVAEVGLSCGGQADILLQPVVAVPAEFWDLLASRAPAALLTRIEGDGAGPAAMVVDRDGRTWGTVDAGSETLVREAVAALAAGRTSSRRVEDAAGVVLVEAWVPVPRLVVVGAGDLVAAIAAQGALLGWDSRSTEGAAADTTDLEGLLDWAGATAALIVLTHDPHIDSPALAAGLARHVAYVGALGSRATQSRRLERLKGAGIDEAALDRIHRPIGLDLGGRRAPEVALSIAAEILACHCGREARPLRDATGPVNDRPTAHLAPGSLS
jgi:xanthine dehydrogenase accessory factor